MQSNVHYILNVHTCAPSCYLAIVIDIACACVCACWLARFVRSALSLPACCPILMQATAKKAAQTIELLQAELTQKEADIQALRQKV